MPYFIRKYKVICGLHKFFHTGGTFPGPSSQLVILQEMPIRAHRSARLAEAGLCRGHRPRRPDALDRGEGQRVHPR